MTANASFSVERVTQDNSWLTKIHRFITPGAVLAMALPLLGGEAVQADVIIKAGEVWEVRSDGGTPSAKTNGTASIGSVEFGGSPGTVYGYAVYVPFDLTGVDEIASVSLHSWVDAVIPQTLPYNVDVYGIGYSDDVNTLPGDGTNLGNSRDLFYVGANDPDSDKIIEDYITPTPGAGTWVDGTEEALVDYLNNRTADVVWFRLNPDAIQDPVGDGNTHNNLFRYGEQDSGADDTDVPYLEITAVPEPATLGLLAVGLAILAGGKRRRAMTAVRGE